MILGGTNVDIMLVLICFSEICVLSQVSFLNDSFEKSKGGKRTWADPICSKQLKFPHEMINCICLFVCFIIAV